MGEEKKRKKDELDEFWDIDSLIPPKRAPRYAHDTEAVEITSEKSATAQKSSFGVLWYDKKEKAPRKEPLYDSITQGKPRSFALRDQKGRFAPCRLCGMDRPVVGRCACL